MRYAIHDDHVVDAQDIFSLDEDPPQRATCIHCEGPVTLKGGSLLGMFFGGLFGSGMYYSHLPGGACDYDSATGDAIIAAHISERRRRLSQFSRPIQGL